MIYLYVSESVLNIFLKQLATFGDTALQLHADPEFQKLLSLNCSEDEKCMGDLLQDTELYVPDSGALFRSLSSIFYITLSEIKFFIVKLIRSV